MFFDNLTTEAVCGSREYCGKRGLPEVQVWDTIAP
jgi:hypothetical protein